MATILNIVETAYRATIEEQDDTILWLTQALKSAGADIAVLLRANAVNYAARGHDASGLSFGELSVAHPPALDRDLQRMMDKGIAIYLVEEDAKERGLTDADLIPGLQKISRREVANIIERHEQVWHW